ncbi:hypothetical protein OF83DRAFT_586810 [Amylostereum chailletii]|nr:hypothetical protein OF83DRAFT_586810 [Amylostereum chailletii]
MMPPGSIRLPLPLRSALHSTHSPLSGGEQERILTTLLFSNLLQHPHPSPVLLSSGPPRPCEPHPLPLGHGPELSVSSVQGGRTYLTQRQSHPSPTDFNAPRPNRRRALCPHHPPPRGI